MEKSFVFSLNIGYRALPFTACFGCGNFVVSDIKMIARVSTDVVQSEGLGLCRT